MIDKSSLNGIFKDDKETDSAIAEILRCENQYRAFYNILTRRACSESVGDSCLRKNKLVMPMWNCASKVMFILPPVTKDLIDTRHPLANNAGVVLATIINKLGKNTNEVHMTNIVKCYSSEQCDYAFCGACYTELEIRAINPKTIVTFGLEACNFVRSLHDLPYYNDMNEIAPGESFKIGDMTVIHTINPQDIISGVASLRNVYKVRLWKDLANAFE